MGEQGKLVMAVGTWKMGGVEIEGLGWIERSACLEEDVDPKRAIMSRRGYRLLPSHCHGQNNAAAQTLLQHSSCSRLSVYISLSPSTSSTSTSTFTSTSTSTTTTTTTTTTTLTTTSTAAASTQATSSIRCHGDPSHIHYQVHRGERMLLRKMADKLGHLRSNRPSVSDASASASSSPSPASSGPSSSTLSVEQRRSVSTQHTSVSDWGKRQQEGTETGVVPQIPMPQIPLQMRRPKGTYRLADFTIHRTLGTGSFGRVHLGEQRRECCSVCKRAHTADGDGVQCEANTTGGSMRSRC